MVDSTPIPHPRSWPVRRLGEFSLKVGSGATPAGGEASYLPRRLQWALLRSQNVFDRRFSEEGLAYISDEQAARLSGVQVQPRDILLNITGDGITFGRACEAPANILPAVVNQHVSIVRVDQRVADPGFVLSYLSHPSVKHYIESFNAGGSRRAITKGHIESFCVPLPPLPEQRVIAHVLGTLDEKIELNRRMNETLEGIARAIFKSWFVDFDPVRAKAEGRDPGLPKPIADLFPDSFEDSDLGQIPAGWEVKPLSDFTTAITKGTTPTQEGIDTAPEGGAQIKYVRVNAIGEDGAILFDKLTTIPESVHLGVLKRSVLRVNDVLYTIAGTIGRISVVEESLLPANTNQAVAIIRPKPAIPSDFLVFTMRQEAFREELHSNIVHAVQANLSLGMLSRARAVVPPMEMLPQLFRPIGDVVKRILAYRTESRTLAALRDTLLPSLISGELRVTAVNGSAGHV